MNSTMSSSMKQLQMLLLTIVLASSSATAAGGFRAELTHLDHPAAGSNKLELLHRMSLPLAGTASHAGSRKLPYKSEYALRLAAGTPPQALELVFATASGFVWTQCQPCMSCFRQRLPVFSPANSSTHARLPCNATVESAARSLPHVSCFHHAPAYIAGHSVGFLVNDTVTVVSDNATSPATVTFGCGFLNHHLGVPAVSGVAGFGNGALSLPAQLGVRKFAHCFTSVFDRATRSPVLFDAAAAASFPAGNSELKQVVGGELDYLYYSTPVLQNPSNPDAYYLLLKGISVGRKRLSVPAHEFAVREDGTGGAMIDSTRALISLPATIYNHLKEAFISELDLPPARAEFPLLDLCFEVPPSRFPPPSTVDVPELVFHFEGMDLALPREGYVVADDRAATLCLAVAAGEEDAATVIGNFAQQNLYVLYDLENEKIAFAPTKCDAI